GPSEAGGSSPAGGCRAPRAAAERAPRASLSIASLRRLAIPRACPKGRRSPRARPQHLPGDAYVVLTRPGVPDCKPDHARPRELRRRYEDTPRRRRAPRELLVVDV